jgi:hypothetical protein
MAGADGRRSAGRLEVERGQRLLLRLVHVAGDAGQGIGIGLSEHERSPAARPAHAAVADALTSAERDRLQAIGRAVP